MTESSPFDPGLPLVEAPALQQQVYWRLRAAILAGELTPGARISPADVARCFGVSTMPVRDALRRLEQEGLVETASRRWTRVVELGPELVEELVPLVSLLEQHAVRTAAPVSAEALTGLREANAAFEAAASAGDVQACIDADTLFHDRLVGLAPGQMLERTAREPRSRLRLLRPQVVEPEFAAASVRDHAGVIEHLDRGDREGAVRALAENWRRGLERFRSER